MNAILRSSRIKHFLRYLSNSLITFLPIRYFRHKWFNMFLDLGKDSNIMMGFTIRKLTNISIGNTTNINPSCMFDSRGGSIIIGDNVDISPEVNIWTLQHDPQDPNFDTNGGPVVIEEFVWIGNRATILPNITIGRGAVVATGAVVTKNVNPWTIVGGVPAREIGKRNSFQNARKPYKPFLL